MRLGGRQGTASLDHLTVTRILPLLTVMMSACTGVINPPIPTATPVPTIPPTPTEVPSTPTPEPERWVKNHRVTEMWSGPAGQSGVVSFGETSHQFCAFQVVRPQDNARLYVFNPYSRNYLWIDSNSVGPTGAPERRAGPQPANQNCSDAIYE